MSTLVTIGLVVWAIVLIVVLWFNYRLWTWLDAKDSPPCTSCFNTGSDRSSGEPCIRCTAGELARQMLDGTPAPGYEHYRLPPETSPEAARSALQMLVAAEGELEEITESHHKSDEIRRYAAAALLQVRAAQLRLSPIAQEASHV